MRMGKQRLFSSLLAFMFILAIATPAQAGDSRQNQAFHKQRLISGAPTFTEASVHDPSVIQADGMYYVFGSHLASAKTSDLLNW